MPRSGSAAPARDQPPAAVTVIVGEEELLVEGAGQAVGAQVTAAGPGEKVDGLAGGPDVHDVRAADLKPGDLTGLTAPSLFGGGCLVIVRSMQDATKDVAAELARQAAQPRPDVVLVLTHSGGAKNNQLLARLGSGGAGGVDGPPVKRFGERLDFPRGEFGRAGRKADDGGLRALLDAVGNDLRELSAACSQLVADTTG